MTPPDAATVALAQRLCDVWWVANKDWLAVAREAQRWADEKITITQRRPYIPPYTESDISQP